MSVSSALSNALSGLSASARRAELSSDNIANALNPDFAAREARLATRTVSGGVEVADVTRRGDPEARTRLRLASAAGASSKPLADASARLAAAIGGPTEPGGTPARVTAFEAALGRLADTPESAALQGDAVAAAGALVRAFNAASDETQSVRAEADATIGRLVETANQALSEIERLNRDIVAAEALGGVSARETPALADAREAWIDRLAEIVPLRSVRREDGAVSLYAPGGAMLLEGRALTFGFTPANAMAADSTLASGALSGLTLGGRPLDAGSQGPIAGGALSAAFEVRDAQGPEAQARLDALAADLVRRFEVAGLDPTLPPGAPGLFTDAGAAFDPALVDGIAGRLRLSAAVDPAAGGEVRRVRDGLGSAAPGPAGEPALPIAFLQALEAAGPPPPGSGLASGGGYGALVGGLYGLAAVEASRAEEIAAAAEGRRIALSDAEAASRGVDVDSELSDLLLIEQIYAANARVVSVADDLLRTLLEI